MKEIKSYLLNGRLITWEEGNDMISRTKDVEKERVSVELDKLSIKIREKDLRGRHQVWISVQGFTAFLAFYPHTKSVTFWIDKEQPSTKVSKRTILY